MISKLWALACMTLSFKAAGTSPEILDGDDECRESEDCSLNALQFRSTAASEEAPENVTDSTDAELGGGWTWGGDKVWGWGSQAGTGVESITSANVHFYDSGARKALSHCGGAGCALIMNPPHHRSKEVPHIHSVRYASYGQHLHEKLEKMVCGSGGNWHRHGLPCHGKAAFFPGFPGIFTKALTSGDISHASVIAWPSSCGGSGTIIELAYHCSIEHQIRGDFNAKFR